MTEDPRQQGHHKGFFRRHELLKEALKWLLTTLLGAIVTSGVVVAAYVFDVYGTRDDPHERMKVAIEDVMTPIMRQRHKAMSELDVSWRAPHPFQHFKDGLAEIHTAKADITVELTNGHYRYPLVAIFSDEPTNVLEYLFTRKSKISRLQAIIYNHPTPLGSQETYSGIDAIHHPRVGTQTALAIEMTYQYGGPRFKGLAKIMKSQGEWEILSCWDKEDDLEPPSQLRTSRKLGITLINVKSGRQTSTEQSEIDITGGTHFFYRQRTDDMSAIMELTEGYKANNNKFEMFLWLFKANDCYVEALWNNGQRMQGSTNDAYKDGVASYETLADTLLRRGGDFGFRTQFPLQD